MDRGRAGGGRDPVRVQHEGRTYEKAQGRWFDCATGEAVPETLATKLEGVRSAARTENLDQLGADSLLQRAKDARDSHQLGQAETLARMALSRSEDMRFCLGAAAVLCSVLRQRGFPAQALEATDALKSAGYEPLLTSRAAAYCDLGRWEEAKATVGRALAIANRPGGEAFNVVRRIKKERPELYGSG